MRTTCPAVLFRRPATMVWKFGNFKFWNFSVSRFLEYKYEILLQNIRANHYSSTCSNVTVPVRVRGTAEKVLTVVVYQVYSITKFTRVL